MDSRKKSLLKTISWRIVAIILSLAVTYLFIGSFALSFEIVITANIVSMITYYFHERWWNKSKLL